MKTDFSKVYTENIFIPMSRAMNEFLLESSELDSLPKYTRRSPYPERDNITVFKRVDLEKRAIDKWGSLENLTLQKDFLKKRQDRARRRLYLFRQSFIHSFSQSFIHSFIPSSKVVLTAVGWFVVVVLSFNALNCLMKLVAWMHTGSHSMFAELVHSMADTINQIILAVGIRQSLKEPDVNHPYGWAKFRNVSSLISGVGIFCVGAGLSFYHGITGLIDPAEPSSLYWALRTLGGSFLLEGGTLVVALRELKHGSEKAKVPLPEYITRSIDPTTNVVLLEDSAAVLGIIIAGTCISITQITGHYLADAIGSLLIGTLLGGVASFIIYTNTAALVGKSIPAERRQALVKELESDRMIRTLIDVKATEAGGKFVRFKAEVDFDGKEVTRYYLEDIDMEKLLQDIKAIQSVEDAETFMLRHGENIVDTLGGAVDRIEKNLKKKHPEIRHVDLEQL
ncbi:hypothetical protein HELRODRAFT_116663 [Helobdella robusta]|uniref:Proton-coupled zinc antiporter SLC30A9, mitochondrial n=1 Tax=Helobdella robusta TaxID=6412 RepID=T1EGG9_HELRO|nr:hypothetical protein HELRODRAFT_116663 [Helobdella robusta]ESN90021.1 hypothetical protein HELRODRAFT_116663 [Helobdella robusta]